MSRSDPSNVKRSHQLNYKTSRLFSHSKDELDSLREQSHKIKHNESVYLRLPSFSRHVGTSIKYQVVPFKQTHTHTHTGLDMLNKDWQLPLLWTQNYVNKVKEFHEHILKLKDHQWKLIELNRSMSCDARQAGILVQIKLNYKSVSNWFNRDPQKTNVCFLPTMFLNLPRAKSRYMITYELATGKRRKSSMIIATILSSSSQHKHVLFITIPLGFPSPKKKYYKQQ